jgi:MinD superfamily P-loop ATPase
MLEKDFYTDGNCISCGKCALLCPAEKIKIIDNRPTWNENIECQFCLGCLHRCPTESIQIKNTKTKILGRIYPQEIKLEELINQK